MKQHWLITGIMLRKLWLSLDFWWNDRNKKFKRYKLVVGEVENVVKNWEKQKISQ
jgi:hypothetical protein